MAGRKPQWPFVVKQLQEIASRGELFTTMADLASRLQVSSRTIHKAIHSDKQLHKWAQGGTKLERVTQYLLKLQSSNATPKSMRQYGRDFGCSFSTVRKAIYQNIKLRQWVLGRDIKLTPSEEAQMRLAIRRARTDSKQARLHALTDRQWLKHFEADRAKQAEDKRNASNHRQLWLRVR